MLTLLTSINNQHRDRGISHYISISHILPTIDRVVQFGWVIGGATCSDAPHDTRPTEGIHTISHTLTGMVMIACPGNHRVASRGYKFWSYYGYITSLYWLSNASPGIFLIYSCQSRRGISITDASPGIIHLYCASPGDEYLLLRLFSLMPVQA